MKLGKSQREKDVTQVVSVAAFRDGKLLFGLRGDSGKWNLPGGHVEPGEELWAAAERELKEETGLTGSRWDRLGFSDVREGLRVHSFICDVQGEPTAKDDPDEEMVAFKWLDPEKLPKSVMDNLHNKKDITLQFLGIQEHKVMDLIWDEDAPRRHELEARLEKGLRGDWQTEGYEIRHQLEPGGKFISITAHGKNGEKVGELDAGHSEAHPGHLVPVMATVHPDHQRKGLATAMYQRAEQVLGAPFARGGYQSPEAKALWAQKGRPFGKDEVHWASEKQPDRPLEKFEQEAGEWLVKATRPQDFKAIARSVTPEGARFADHRPQMQEHPPGHSPLVEHYNNEVLRGGKVFAPKKGKQDNGITRKLIFETHHQPQGELFAPNTHGISAKFMVKPYHEGLVRATKSYQKFPVQGWSEMANQSLYHAAGIGHLHQKVHVSEHNMGAGHENEPALVVHMDPGLNTVHHSGGFSFDDPQHSHDAMKIGLMDFLTNNLDRHANNIMVGTEKAQPGPDQAPGSTNEFKLPILRKLLAIDHGRSFQYVNNHHHKWDSQVKVKKINGFEDSMKPYLFGRRTTGLSGLVPYRQGDHQSLEQYAKPLFDWWSEAGPKVRAAMDQQLEHIKDPEAKAHIRRNFEARANYLDERAGMGIENYGTEWYDDPVPQYHPGERTDDEIQDERKREAVAQYEREEAERRAKGV